MSYEGKVIKSVSNNVNKYFLDLSDSLLIEFTDGSTIFVKPNGFNTILVETTL
jgi:hypothetical protein